MVRLWVYGDGELAVSLIAPTSLREVLSLAGLDAAHVGPVLRGDLMVPMEDLVYPGDSLVVLPPLDGG